jgi:nascent polypeptide-associated complex subunit alpha
MFGGGGGMNPRKMEQMMEQMGIDVDEIDATEVIIRTEGGEELYFDDPEVTKMDARGQETYQVVGEPESREQAELEAGEGGESESDAGVPDADVDIVVQRTGASEAAARETLEEVDGDLAAAVERLE